MKLLGQMVGTFVLLINTAKLPYTEVIPVYTPPAVEDSAGLPHSLVDIALS